MIENRDVDLVVTYLDDSVENWQEDFKKQQDKEIRSGIQSESNRQAFGEERIRNWDTLRYYLRGVEANLDWIRNVIIVMYDEEQIPDWLNVDNERIRVVFHKDYMEEDLLPTFNAMQIGMYISNIDGLSDKYIMSDDDYYFINKIDRSMFFRDNKTVQMNNRMNFEPFGERYLTASDGVFYSIMNNNLEIEKKYMGEEKIKYWISHLPEARDKLMEQEIIKDNYDEFKRVFKLSKFRHKNQYCAQIFPNILKIRKDCVFDNCIGDNCKYVTLKSTVEFDMYKDYSIVCFNDTEQLDDFYTTKEKLIEFLESKLPNKSRFEK